MCSQYGVLAWPSITAWTIRASQNEKQPELFAGDVRAYFRALL
jgi:hypothetical protein